MGGWKRGWVGEKRRAGGEVEGRGKGSCEMSHRGTCRGLGR